MTTWTHEDVRALYKRSEAAEARAEAAEARVEVLRAKIRTLEDRIHYSPNDDNANCRCGTCYPCVLRRIGKLERLICGATALQSGLDNLEERLAELEDHPHGCQCTMCTG